LADFLDCDYKMPHGYRLSVVGAGALPSVPGMLTKAAHVLCSSHAAALAMTVRPDG
jgi:hypothetical protein